MTTDKRLRIAIIGAGASGTLLAVHLLRQPSLPADITLIERAAEFGRGAAYASPNPDHTLNVMAHMMGGEAEADVEGFADWLARQAGLTSSASIRNTYAARFQYGTYLGHLLAAAERDVPGRLTRIRGEVVEAVPHGDRRYALRLANGARVDADIVVLCLGNLDPMPFLPQGEARCIDDPWRPGALESIGPADRLLVIGTGLTMVDTVLDLLARGYGGAITAISRHGVLPLEDAMPVPYADFFSPDIAAKGIRAVMRALRREVAIAAAKGIGWHSVVEAFRVHTSAIWLRLDDANRRRFIRHLRSLWFAYRHRLPPQHMRRLDALRKEGRLEILAGRIVEMSPNADGVRVSVRRRGGQTIETKPVDWVINCTGPEGDYSRSRLPLVRSLIGQGLVRPDAYRLGIDVDADFTALRADGSRAEGLVTLGPPTRGRFWEVTAVPHLRRQVEAFVARLVASRGTSGAGF
jgi:uncharacterized NAD(P)/FAD-binding protein YdhS